MQKNATWLTFMPNITSGSCKVGKFLTQMLCGKHLSVFIWHFFNNHAQYYVLD